MTYVNVYIIKLNKRELRFKQNYIYEHIYTYINIYQQNCIYEFAKFYFKM